MKHETDVLVVGGGPAATWAALKAARAGATVVLADKGYCGTSGATASVGTGVWYVPPDPEAREAAMASREALGGYLADRRWMTRVLDQTYDAIDELAVEGRYPFPVGEDGQQIRTGLQGPEYMRRMRIRVRRAGVRVLDHSPVTELLTDADGAIAGAAGYQRQARQDFQVRAGAVVLATGGCAFLSKALGCDVNTGDGALLAAETGAELSGMEFSNAYGIAPEHTSVTKTAFYNFATFYHADGTVLEGAGSQRGRSVIAKTLLTEKVYCRLDRADAAAREGMRRAQPNFFLPFDRMGVDPFTDLFSVTLLAEGTVRGTGGIRIVDDGCATTVPGLYAAGDAATRERICGGFTGGGSHNAAWAISSGIWAGRAAARYVSSLGPTIHRRAPSAEGGAGLRPTGKPGDAGESRDVIATVQKEVLPYEKNYLRHGDRADPGPACARRHLGPCSRVAVRRRAPGPAGGGHGRARPLDVRVRTGPQRNPRHGQASRLSRPGFRSAPPHPERRPRQRVDPGHGACRVIELVSADRCITCDKCIAVCPINVFDRGPDGVPVIARQEDCQTCFQCEANCPTDALFVAPQTHPQPSARDAGRLAESGQLGSYRKVIGWGKGRTPGSLLAIGPALDSSTSSVITS